MDKEEIEKDLAALINQRNQLIAQLQNVTGAIMYLSQKQQEIKKSEEQNEDKNNND